MFRTSSFAGSGYSEESLVETPPTATLEGANRHFQASRVSKRTDKKDSELKNEDRCECCEKRICGGEGAHLFSLRALDDLAELGLAFPLFFYLIWCLGCMLLWITLVASIGNIYFEYKSSPPDNPQYYENDKTKWPYILHLVALLGLFLMYIVSTYLMRRKAAKLRHGMVTEADYSVTMKNLGTDWRSADLKQHIEDQMLVNGEKIEVVGINSSYQLTEYLELDEDIRRIKAKMNHLRVQKFLSTPNPSTEVEAKQTASEPSAEVEAKQTTPEPSAKVEAKQTISDLSAEIENEQTALRGKLGELNKHAPQKTGVAVVTFNTIKDATAFEKQWGQGQLRKIFWCCKPKAGSPLIFNDKIIYVKKAEEPKDIAWENQHYGRINRLLAQLISLFILIVAVLILFAVMMLFAWITKLEENTKGLLGYLERAPVSFATYYIGQGMDKLANALAQREHHHSISRRNVFVAYKLTILKTINTLFTPMFASLLEDDFYSSLRTQMYSLIYTNALWDPFQKLITPSNLVNFARRRMTSRELKQGVILLTQEQASQNYELPEFDIAIWYSNELMKFMLVLMYTPLIPVAAPVFLVGFVLDYWLVKFTLLRFASTPGQINEGFAVKMMEFVKIAILLYSFGMLLFFYLLSDVAQDWGIIAIFLGLGYFIIPCSFYRLFCICCTSKPTKPALTFQDQASRFPHDEVIHT